jgi:hypothetical protein
VACFTQYLFEVIGTDVRCAGSTAAAVLNASASVTERN